MPPEKKAFFNFYFDADMYVTKCKLYNQGP